MRQVYVAYDGKDAPTADRFNYCPQCKTALTFKEIDYKRRSVCPSCGFIRFQNPAPAVSLLIVKDEQVLLGRRGRDPGRGQWATPSGYIEYEDDFLTTAIREAKEETGLDVELKSIVHVVSSFTSPGYHFLSIYLLAGVVGGELGAGDDLDAVDWFPLAGPWPDLAFQEDVDLLETYSTTKSEGLPIDPNFRARRGRVQEIERSEWLKERRRVGKERYDTLFAPIYDENWGAWIGPTHQECIQRFLSLCPPQGTILDAACGTGKYWPLILASGRRVWGTDQSEGMLARAKAKFPDVQVEKTGLQEMQYQEAFEGAICMDAIENVFPEDWALVLSNLHRALKPEGYLYFTVEIAAENDILNAFTGGRKEGLPIVYGEWLLEGGYHYYPSIEQVKAWLEEARFRLMAEAISDDYHHFLVQREG